MAKRYNELVAVYKPKSQPSFFVWKGRRYDVMRIMHHWTQANQWWKPDQVEPEFFQVAAKPHRGEAPVTCELRHDRRGRTWRLVRVMD